MADLHSRPEPDPSAHPGWLADALLAGVWQRLAAALGLSVLLWLAVAWALN
jgi:hypothetical protein